MPRFSGGPFGDSRSSQKIQKKILMASMGGDDFARWYTLTLRRKAHFFQIFLFSDMVQKDLPASIGKGN